MIKCDRFDYFGSQQNKVPSGARLAVFEGLLHEDLQVGG
jgi:hypothetical protein